MSRTSGVSHRRFLFIHSRAAYTPYEKYVEIRISENPPARRVIVLRDLLSLLLIVGVCPFASPEASRDPAQVLRGIVQKAGEPPMLMISAAGCIYSHR